MHALQFIRQKREFYNHIDTRRHLLSDIVAHHLPTTSANVTISGQVYWRHGPFNLCVPVLVDNAANPTLPQFLMIRFHLARIMPSLRSSPLPHIGAFRVDNDGYLQFDNRPLGVQFTIQDNEGIPLNTDRHQIFTRVKDFVLNHLEAFSNRLLRQPNGIESHNDAYYQMTSLAAAHAIFPQVFRRDLDKGPFVFTLTDLHRSNILVNDD